VERFLVFDDQNGLASSSQLPDSNLVRTNALTDGRAATS
jgi:hypothetical protein